MDIPQSIASLITASPNNINEISLIEYSPEFKESLISYINFLSKKIASSISFQQNDSKRFKFSGKTKSRQIISSCDYQVESLLQKTSLLADNRIRKCAATFHDSYMIKCEKCGHIYCHRHFNGILLNAHARVGHPFVDYESNDNSIDNEEIYQDFIISKMIAEYNCLMYGSGLCENCLKIDFFTSFKNSINPSLINEYNLGILNYNRDEGSIKGLASLNQITSFGKNIIMPINVDELTLLVNDDLRFGFKQIQTNMEDFDDAKEFISTWLPHLDHLITQVSNYSVASIKTSDYGTLIEQELLDLKERFHDTRSMYALYEIIRFAGMLDHKELFLETPELNLDDPDKKSDVDFYNAFLESKPFPESGGIISKYGNIEPLDCVKNKGHTLEYNLFQIMMYPGKMDTYLDKIMYGDLHITKTAFKRPGIIIHDQHFKDFCFYIQRYMKLLSWIEPMLEPSSIFTKVLFEKLSDNFNKNPSFIEQLLPFRIGNVNNSPMNDLVHLDDIERLLSYLMQQIKDCFYEVKSDDLPIHYTVQEDEERFLVNISMNDIVTNDGSTFRLKDLALLEENQGNTTALFSFNNIKLFLTFFGRVEEFNEDNKLIIKYDENGFKSPDITNLVKHIDPAFAWDDELRDNLSILLENSSGKILIDLDEGMQEFRKNILNEIGFGTYYSEGASVKAVTGELYHIPPTLFKETIAEQDNSKYLVSEKDISPYPTVNITLPSGKEVGIYRNFTKDIFDTNFILGSDAGSSPFSSIIQKLLNIMYCLPVIAQPYLQALEITLVKQLIDASIGFDQERKVAIKHLITIYYPFEYLIRRIFHDTMPAFLEQKQVKNTKTGIISSIWENGNEYPNYTNANGDLHVAYLLLQLKDHLFKNYFSRYYRDKKGNRRSTYKDFNEDAMKSIQENHLESRESSYYTMDHNFFYVLLTHLDLIDLKILEHVNVIKQIYKSKIIPG